jgi:hypothetical protein
VLQQRTGTGCRPRTGRVGSDGGQRLSVASSYSREITCPQRRQEPVDHLLLLGTSLPLEAPTGIEPVYTALQAPDRALMQATLTLLEWRGYSAGVLDGRAQRVAAHRGRRRTSRDGTGYASASLSPIEGVCAR